jgi:hypothetical protein
MLDYIAVITTEKLVLGIWEFLFYEINPITLETHRVISQFKDMRNTLIPDSYTDRSSKTIKRISLILDIIQSHMIPATRSPTR